MNQAKYVFVVAMDVDPEKEDLFNEVYDNEHIPFLLEIPGVADHVGYGHGDGRNVDQRVDEEQQDHISDRLERDLQLVAQVGHADCAESALGLLAAGRGRFCAPLGH